MTKENLIDVLVAGSVPTGSRVYGGAREDSDWDYILKPGSIKDHLMGNVELMVTSARGYGELPVFYIVDPRNNRKYNFLWFENDKEKLAWVKTTEVLYGIPQEGLRDKKERVRIFREVLGRIRKELGVSEGNLLFDRHYKVGRRYTRNGSIVTITGLYKCGRSCLPHCNAYKVIDGVRMDGCGWSGSDPIWQSVPEEAPF